MALTIPYRQHNYLGEFVSDSSCEAEIVARGWDISGSPQGGMWYYNTSTRRFRFYINGRWEIGPSKIDDFHFRDDFVGRRLLRSWSTTVSGTGSSVIQTKGDMDFGVCTLKSGPGWGMFAEIDWGDRRVITMSYNFRLYLRLRLNAPLSDSFTQVSMYNGSSDYIRFERADAGNWFGITEAGGVATSTDTSIAASSNWVSLEMEYDGSSVKFFIDGSLVATNTTNIPTVNCQLLIHQETLVTGPAHECDIDLIDIRQDR